MGDQRPERGGSVRIEGGRRAAEVALGRIRPESYARSRNYLDGDVTRLSPYLRHGTLSLAEVRDHALRLVERPEEAEKLIAELGWRDYWQRLYAVLGDGVWQDREAWKTGWSAEDYARELPAEVIAGSTGLACMDGFSEELRATGYLHNHARMWFAAWVVHWLRVRWQAGAQWFLSELLDGDAASNNLSWQWVASTFSSKPYFFNRENLERYTGGIYCSGCEARSRCPFEGSYEALESKLFPRLSSSGAVSTPDGQRSARAVATDKPAIALQPVLVWVHTGALNPKAEIFARYADAASCFVWDERWLAAERPSANRVRFIEQCLVEMPAAMAVRRGDMASQVLAAARELKAQSVVAMETVDPGILRAALRIEEELPVVWVQGPAFVSAGPFDLKRFSRFWSKAKVEAMRAGDSVVRSWL